MQKLIKIYQWLALAAILLTAFVLLRKSGLTGRPLVLTLVLIFLVYIFAKEFAGRWWALVPVFLLALSPHILSRGSYLAANIDAALTMILAIYFFLKFLSEPERKSLIFAGLCLGAGLTTGFSALILIPYFLAVITFFYLSRVGQDWRHTAPLARIKRFNIRFFRYYRSIFIILFIGFAVVYAVYFTAAQSFSAEKQTRERNLLTRAGPMANPALRYLIKIEGQMAGNQYLRPFSKYLLVVLGDWIHSANTLYPSSRTAASFFREPKASLILIGGMLLLAFWQTLKNFRAAGFKILKNYLKNDFSQFAMVFWIIFSVGVLAIKPFGRALSPLLILPFIYILTAIGLKNRIVLEIEDKETFFGRLGAAAAGFSKYLLKLGLVLAILVWYAVETAK